MAHPLRYWLPDPIVNAEELGHQSGVDRVCELHHSGLDDASASSPMFNVNCVEVNEKSTPRTWLTVIVNLPSVVFCVGEAATTVLRNGELGRLPDGDRIADIVAVHLLGEFVFVPR